MVIVACKDGRQLLSIPRATKKHAGLYECSASNVLGSITSSCTVAVAREHGVVPGMGKGSQQAKLSGLTGAPHLSPGIPGKLTPPEVPQTYQDTALVLWKPGDGRAPCTYTLERRVEGEALGSPRGWERSWVALLNALPTLESWAHPSVASALLSTPCR